MLKPTRILILTSTGFASQSETQVDDPGQWPDFMTSVAHYCPYCSRYWALVEIQGSGQSTSTRTACDECRERWVQDPLRIDEYIPGSLIGALTKFSTYDSHLLAGLPWDLLRREFDIHWKHREIINGQICSESDSDNPL